MEPKEKLLADEAALNNRSWINRWVMPLIGAALFIGGFALMAMAGTPAGATGGGAAVALGVATAAYVYYRESALNAEFIDLHARKSAQSLSDRLQAQGVELTPEQEHALLEGEYREAKERWGGYVQESRKQAVAVSPG